MLGKNKKPTSNELHLNCDGKSINEPIEIANTVNDHFSHTPNKLLQKLPPSSSKFNYYLYSPNRSPMFFFQLLLLKSFSLFLKLLQNSVVVGMEYPLLYLNTYYSMPCLHLVLYLTNHCHRVNLYQLLNMLK